MTDTDSEFDLICDIDAVYQFVDTLIEHNQLGMIGDMCRTWNLGIGIDLTLSVLTASLCVRSADEVRKHREDLIERARLHFEDAKLGTWSGL